MLSAYVLWKEKVNKEACEGFGWGYRSDTGSYEFTSNSIGASTEVFGNKDLEFGLGVELRNYDKCDIIDMIMEAIFWKKIVFLKSILITIKMILLFIWLYL